MDFGDSTFSKRHKAERIHFFAFHFTTMGQSHTKPEIKTRQTFRPNKYLSKVELVSIKCVFNSLKSDFPDHFECIEPKNFLVHTS